MCSVVGTGAAIRPARRLLILYGSQEGCAESVAERLAEDAQERHGWDVELCRLATVAPK